jgi:hypothetical protein
MNIIISWIAAQRTALDVVAFLCYNNNYKYKANILNKGKKISRISLW